MPSSAGIDVFVETARCRLPTASVKMRLSIVNFILITIPYYFLCRSAKPIVALLVAAKAQIVCEKVFFTLSLLLIAFCRIPAARLHERRAACCPLYLLLLLVLNLAVAVGGVQLWEILKSGFLRPKKPKKFFISGCGRNVENVEDFFYSTSRLKTLCEMLKICLGFRGKPVSADRPPPGLSGRGCS